MHSSTIMHEWSPWPISRFDYCVVFEDTTYTEVCGLKNHKKFLIHARRATIHTIGMRLPPGNVHSAPDPDKVVCHIPNEISHFTTYPWRAADTIELCVVMANSDETKPALDKYTELVNDHYEEPIGENFRNYTDSILAGIGVDNDVSSTGESDINEQ